MFASADILNVTGGGTQEDVVHSKKTDIMGSNNGGLRGKLNKVVLAYSGGLDTSVIVPWLRYDTFLHEYGFWRCSCFYIFHKYICSCTFGFLKYKYFLS